MDTAQINELCFTRFPNFLGCVSIDELKNKKIRDQLCHDFNVGSFVIFNIDDSSKPGTHWVLLHRMVGGKLFLFDSFGAFGSNAVFRFNEFNDVEKNTIPSYEDSLNGQFFQYSDDYNYKNYFTFAHNRINTLLLDKNLLVKYTNYDNMTTPLYYLLDFLKQL